jgi:hypothetical protein
MKKEYKTYYTIEEKNILKTVFNKSLPVIAEIYPAVSKEIWAEYVREWFQAHQILNAWLNLSLENNFRVEIDVKNKALIMKEYKCLIDLFLYICYLKFDCMDFELDIESNIVTFKKNTFKLTRIINEFVSKKDLIKLLYEIYHPEISIDRITDYKQIIFGSDGSKIIFSTNLVDIINASNGLSMDSCFKKGGAYQGAPFINARSLSGIFMSVRDNFDIKENRFPEKIGRAWAYFSDEFEVHIGRNYGLSSVDFQEIVRWVISKFKIDKRGLEYHDTSLVPHINNQKVYTDGGNFTALKVRNKRNRIIYEMKENSKCTGCGSERIGENQYACSSCESKTCCSKCGDDHPLYEMIIHKDVSGSWCKHCYDTCLKNCVICGEKAHYKLMLNFKNPSTGEDRYYHKNCLHSTCEHCDRLIPEDYVQMFYKDLTGKVVCQECFSNNYVTCPSCNTFISKYSTRNNVCMTCFNKDYGTCDKCGANFDKRKYTSCTSCNIPYFVRDPRTSSIVLVGNRDDISCIITNITSVQHLAKEFTAHE